jgi:hypothetical protein
MAPLYSCFYQTGKQKIFRAGTGHEFCWFARRANHTGPIRLQGGLANEARGYAPDEKFRVTRQYGKEGRRITLSIIRTAGFLSASMRDPGQMFTHIHDQGIEISERFYVDPLT